MMTIGMLWLDADSHRTLEEKVKRAADYYADKYGRKPTEVLINDKALPEQRQIGSMKAIPARNILPHHFWIGVGGDS